MSTAEHWLLRKIAGLPAPNPVPGEVAAASARLREAGVARGATVALQESGAKAARLLLALLDNGNVVFLRGADQDGLAEWTIGEDRMDRRRPRSHPLVEPLRSRGSAGLALASSGTGGKPKVALYNFDRFLEKFRAAPYRPLRTVMVLGLDHIGGLDTFFSVVSRGGTVHWPAAPTPDDVCALVERERIDFISVSPTFLNLVLLSEAHLRHDLGSLRIVNFGAEVMPPELLERWRRILPAAELRATFGTTETGTLRVRPHPDDPLLLKIEGARVRAGMLNVRSPHGMIGYLDAPSPLTADGWFPTGDLVEEEGGYVRILGRACETVNVGGRKVLPAELEDVIRRVPGVRDVRVYGAPHAITGQMVVADVVWTAEADCRSTLKHVLKQTLERHKCPSRINVVAEIPHSERLKTLRRPEIALGAG